MSFELFIPLKKVDVEKRLIYGVAAMEMPDRAGETFDYEASKPNIIAWSNDFLKATGGESWGNLRAMHQNISAGKLIDIAFDDEGKTVSVCAKVVDDAEWGKVLEKVYTGFSFGGRYGKRWIDPSGQKRYEAKPAELSLADRPAIAGATFTLVKADGSETKESWDVSGAAQKSAGGLEGDRAGADDQLAKIAAGIEAGGKALASFANAFSAAAAAHGAANMPQAIADRFRAAKDRELEKIAKREDISDADKARAEKEYGDVLFADPKNKKYPLDADHVRHDWSYINMPKNAAKYSAKDLKTIKARIIAAWKRYIDPKGPPSAREERMKKIETVEDLLKYAGEEVDDSSQAMYALQYLTNLLQKERNESHPEAADQIDALIAAIQKIKEFIASEIQENDPAEGMSKLELALDLKKSGARHSKADQERIQAVHDHAVALGADCPALEKVDSPARGAQPALGDPAVEERISSLAAENADLKKRLEKIETTAVRPKAFRTVGKGEDYDPAQGLDEPVKELKKADGSIDHEAMALEEIKRAQRKPQAVLRG